MLRFSLVRLWLFFSLTLGALTCKAQEGRLLRVRDIIQGVILANDAGAFESGVVGSPPDDFDGINLLGGFNVVALCSLDMGCYAGGFATALWRVDSVVLTRAGSPIATFTSAGPVGDPVEWASSYPVEAVCVSIAAGDVWTVNVSPHMVNVAYDFGCDMDGDYALTTGPILSPWTAPEGLGPCEGGTINWTYLSGPLTVGLDALTIPLTATVSAIPEGTACDDGTGGTVDEKILAELEKIRKAQTNYVDSLPSGLFDSSLAAARNLALSLLESLPPWVTNYVDNINGDGGMSDVEPVFVFPEASMPVSPSLTINLFDLILSGLARYALPVSILRNLLAAASLFHLFKFIVDKIKAMLTGELEGTPMTTAAGGAIPGASLVAGGTLSLIVAGIMIAAVALVFAGLDWLLGSFSMMEVASLATASGFRAAFYDAPNLLPGFAACFSLGSLLLPWLTWLTCGSVRWGWDKVIVVACFASRWIVKLIPT